MQLLADFLKKGIAALEPLYPAAEARSILLLLCEELIGTKSYTHIVEPLYSISPEGEGTLEEELLVQEAVRLAGKGCRVLDLCTGSGCIAWSVALSVPGAQVVGVDISEKALQVARSQDFSPAPTFVQADVLDTEQEFNHGPFDLILSNPPYVMDKEKAQMRRNVLEHEPAQALFVSDEDPLVFYRAVARWSQRFLAPGGKGLTEINETLGEETLAVFAGAGFRNCSIKTDFSDKNRFVFYAR